MEHTVWITHLILFVLSIVLMAIVEGENYHGPLALYLRKHLSNNAVESIFGVLLMAWLPDGAFYILAYCTEPGWPK